MGVPSPLLAEGPGCGLPPLLAGGSAGVGGGWSWVRLPATPGWGLPAAVVAAFPRGWVGGFPCCVCLWRGTCWRVRCVFVVVVWVWVCRWCVLVRVWRVAVGFPGWGLLLV